MLFGQGLGLLAPLLAADKNGKAAYEALEQSHEFRNPCKWSEIQAHVYDGIILPGGHASGMKEYLESEILKKIIEDFFLLNKPIGAICHGVVLVARTLTSGKSVLTNRKTTSLLARQELLAWGLTKIWLGDYYRTYPQTVEGEVRSVLNSQDGFLPGPMPILRDHPLSLSRGFTVRDQNYLSARWPGDAHRFGRDFLEMVKN
jgi:protease I